MPDLDRPSPGDELVEEVDLDGRVLRIVPRNEMRTNRLRHRAAFIAVHDGHGRLLIHQRSSDKDVWPSRWDIAAGGVAAVGESWDNAAARELEEELGLRAPLTFLGTDTFENDDVSVIGGLFVARHDPATDSTEHGTVQMVDGEAVAFRWADLVELDTLLVREPFCPDSIAMVLPRIRDLLAAPNNY